MSEINHIQLISNLLNLSSDAIVIADPFTSNIIFVNEKMCTNLGYSRDELQKMRVIDFDTVVSNTLLWEKAINFIREYGSLIVQSEHRRKDGTVFPVEISIKFSELDNKSYIVAIVRNITDRKLYEEAILASENKFRNLSENISGLVYQADPETFASVYVNKAHERLYGYSVEEWLRCPDLWADTIYVEDKERVLAAFKEARRKLKDGIIEYRIKSKYNNIRWVEDHYSWALDKKGKPTSLNGVVYDITERKRANKELSTRLCQQASIAELSQSALAGTGIGVRMNESFKCMAEGLEVEYGKILKLLPDGNSLLLLAGIGWREGLVGSAIVTAGPDSQAGYTLLINEPVIVADFRAETRFNVPPLLQEHGVVSGISVVISGKERPFGVLGAHTDKQRTFTRNDVNFLRSAANVIGAAIQRRRTEEDLEESENRFKRIFNTTSASIREEDYSEVAKAIDALKARGVKDFRRYLDENPDFVSRAVQMVNILDVNNATLKLYGASSKSEILGPLNNIFTPESYKVFKENLVAIAEGKGYFEAEIINKRLDGKPIELLMSCEIPSQHSEFTNLLVSIFDITERKKMEHELLKMHKLESLGVLAGGIAHDFNNVMTGVLGYITLAKIMAGSRNKVIENLSSAEKACLRTKELTQQLITFSKGGTPVKKNIFITELIKDSVTFSLSGSKAKPVFNIPDDLWPTEVDEGQISQVINNLILNAEQSMPEGGIIEVGCENIVIGEGNAISLNKGRYVKMTVSDQGCGIAREYLDRIFDPFFTTKQQGSGLGLSTVYSIIKRHDGYIAAESELGKGTTFYVYLPASENGAVKREEEENPIAGTGRILLVDDEEIVRDVGQQMLKRLGYEVEIAEDGLKAIEFYKIAKDSGRPFDVVILDLTIPGGMGGKEAIRNLLMIDPDVKAIVSSGYSVTPVISEYKEFGFKGYITKPYKLVEIGKAVNRVIRNE